MTEVPSSGRQGPGQERYDDEISLVDLWLVLVRRKWFVFLVIILCTAAGLVYALTQPVQYEYKTNIELARVHAGSDRYKDLELVMSRENSMSLLELVIIPAKREQLLEEHDAVPRVNIADQGDHHLLLISTGEPQKKDQVIRLHKMVAEELAGVHAQQFKKAKLSRIKPFENKADMIHEQIQTLEDLLHILTARSQEKDGISSIVDAQQMGDIRRELVQVRRDRVETESVIETIEELSHPTQINFLGVESENPVGTNKSLVAALSLVLGVMLGIFGAFFAEFIAKAKMAAREQ